MGTKPENTGDVCQAPEFNRYSIVPELAEALRVIVPVGTAQVGCTTVGGNSVMEGTPLIVAEDMTTQVGLFCNLTFGS